MRYNVRDYIYRGYTDWLLPALRSSPIHEVEMWEPYRCVYVIVRTHNRSNSLRLWYELKYWRRWRIFRNSTQTKNKRFWQYIGYFVNVAESQNTNWTRFDYTRCAIWAVELICLLMLHEPSGFSVEMTQVTRCKHKKRNTVLTDIDGLANKDDTAWTSYTPSERLYDRARRALNRITADAWRTN